MQTRTIPPLTRVGAAIITVVLALGAIGAIAGASAHAASTPAASGTTISTAHSSLGTYLVGPSGRTIYLWKADLKNESVCTGKCLKVWPPVIVKGAIHASGGVKAGLLKSIKAKGGRQLTYNGHPLYYYAGDHKAGQTNGQDFDSFGDPWFVVSTAGRAILGG